MNTHDWHALLRIIRVPIGDGELRGVNRVAVEEKKIGGSGRRGRKPPQGANLEVLILGEGERKVGILNSSSLGGFLYLSTRVLDGEADL